jgi:hypothetical protein
LGYKATLPGTWNLFLNVQSFVEVAGMIRMS